MDNIEKSLMNSVKAARELLQAADAMRACGYEGSPFAKNYEAIAESIYQLIGESVDFDKSVTYIVLNAPYLTIGRRVEMLMAEYRKNFPKPSAPLISEHDNKDKHAIGYSCSSVTYPSPKDHVTLQG